MINWIYVCCMIGSENANPGYASRAEHTHVFAYIHTHTPLWVMSLRILWFQSEVFSSGYFNTNRSQWNPRVADRIKEKSEPPGSGGTGTGDRVLSQQEWGDGLPRMLSHHFLPLAQISDPRRRHLTGLTLVRWLPAPYSHTLIDRPTKGHQMGWGLGSQSNSGKSPDRQGQQSSLWEPSGQSGQWCWCWGGW